jgi:CRP-like cAMP-binding protein
MCAEKANPEAMPEAMIDHLVEAGQFEQASELLYQLAIENAKKRDFIKSEAFRDRLYEVDSMALTRIVEVNELIEHEKSRAITPDHRRLWARFFEGLSPEEANAFFFALKEEEFDSEALILQQGQRNDRLYLIDKGQLKQIYNNQEKEVLINRLGSGDIVGEDTFFSVNVCTASVKTLTQSRVKYLDRSDLERLKRDHALLDASLRKICCSGRSLFERLRQKGLDRRAFKRFNLNTKMVFQVLSVKEAALRQAITAEMWDISKEGLSFYFQSKNKEAVRSLIGRTLGVRFQLTIAGEVKTLAVTGVVHGVESHPMEEYSVHLKLNRAFSDQAIKAIHLAASDN